MHFRTLLLLLVLVLGLGGLVLWQMGREQQVEPAQRELLPGLSREALEAIRIDSLERGLQLRLERDAEGVWGLVDPLAYPADASLVSQLVDALALQRVEPWEGDPSALGLRPPRAVLEVEQRGADGLRERRIEVGAVDVDRQHVFLSVDGALVRASSTLNTLLELPLPEWRRHEILSQVSPMTVVSLRRSGQAFVPGQAPVELALEAERTDYWKATQPFVARLGPEAFGTLLGSLCALRAAGFEDDAPGPLEYYGLEPPDFRVELTTLRGDSYALRFGRARSQDRLTCLLEGWPHVFTVAPETIGWLMAPSEALVDLELARVTRDSVTAIRLLDEGRETRLERMGFGWRVSSSGGSEPPLPARAADGERVADLLGRIERTRLAEVLPGLEFEPTDPPSGIYVETPRGTFGGELGSEHASPRGTVGVLFRRPGETLVGLLESDVQELVRTDPRSLRSDVLHRLAELDVAQVQVVAAWADERRVWGRDERGRWIPAGSTAEARDFARLVDRLMVVRAVRHLEPSEEVDGIQPLAVACLDKAGGTLQAFALLLVSGSAEAPEEAEVLYRSETNRALVDGRLYFGLLELLGLP